jgi:predicted HTH domain antitoxin
MHCTLVKTIRAMSGRSRTMVSLTIQLPDELPSKDKHQLEALARETLIVKLYEQGEIGSGYAAELLGMSRRAFLDLLGEYGVSAFDPTTDVATEATYE